MTNYIESLDNLISNALIMYNGGTTNQADNVIADYQKHGMSSKQF